MEDETKEIWKQIEEEEFNLRKWLIEMVEELRKANSTNAEHNGMCSKAIAWIEKQANHANFRNKIQIGDKVTRNQDGMLVNLSQLNRVAKKDEKQGEQKLSDIDNKFIRMRETKPKDIFEFLDRLTTVEQEFLWEHIEKVKKIDREEREQKSANKVEPKFKVGDYIERKDGLGCHAKIIFVGGNVYGCEKLIHSEDESSFFEFMFKNQDEFQISSDFKDADEIGVIVSEMVNKHNKPIVFDGKDQGRYEDIRDILRELINNDKYTRSAIECDLKWFTERFRYMKPQPKQEWSEEDKEHIKSLLERLEGMCKKDATFIRTKFAVSEDEDWLKSLSPQNRWKPSDLPHWKKSTLPNDSCVTGFNSDYFVYKGYSINYKELFKKLPKDD